jgi:hypothetical protein
LRDCFMRIGIMRRRVMLIGLCMCIGIYSLRYVDPFTVLYPVIGTFANDCIACGTEEERGLG